MQPIRFLSTAALTVGFLVQDAESSSKNSLDCLRRGSEVDILRFAPQISVLINLGFLAQEPPLLTQKIMV